jgi:hypothetical protein
VPATLFPLSFFPSLHDNDENDDDDGVWFEDESAAAENLHSRLQIAAARERFFFPLWRENITAMFQP